MYRVSLEDSRKSGYLWGRKLRNLGKRVIEKLP